MDTETSSSPILQLLQYRRHGLCKRARERLPTFAKNKLNADYGGIYALVNDLKIAIDNVQWVDIGRNVSSLMGSLLDNSILEVPLTVPKKKKLERDIFISLGGVRELLRMFGRPICPPDARTIPEITIKRRAEVWNEVMVLLREIFFSTPLLADKLFTNTQMVFLFTMLHHQCVFENTMKLLEEVLASRSDTFNLSEVPKLYDLVSRFSTRQVGHFCRILALVLFESEDRQIMESARVLKSFELLQLRRDRMTKTSFNTVELNQSLIIGMPHMLERLVCLLKILNYGPTVSEYIRHNVSGSVPLSSDILVYLSGREGTDEWRHFTRIQAIVDAQRSIGTAASLTDREENAEILNALLSAFSTNRTQAADGNAVYDPIASILSVMQVAHRVGIAPSGLDNYEGVMEMLMDMNDPDAEFRARRRGGSRRNRRNPGPSEDDSAYYSSYTASTARQELQFYSMVLAPHQIEILFVMCTLLCGRRKLEVQNMFDKAGLPDVLVDMHVRMSWTAPAYNGPNPYEHVHGPSCECNPESALRVQYLRLVHNFLDRDFVNSPLKLSMLSNSDRAVIGAISESLIVGRGLLKAEESAKEADLPSSTGLIGELVLTLMRQPDDSVYQFWLSSCLECFLRGQTDDVQIFFAKSGLLSYLLKKVIIHNNIRQTESLLQTSFDLVGELMKFNRSNLDYLEHLLCSSGAAADTNSAKGDSASSLSLSNYDYFYGLDNLISGSVMGDRFCSFIKVVMDNIIDSNVFLRSLYLTIEMSNCEGFGDSKVASRRVLSFPSSQKRLNDGFGHINDCPLAPGASYLSHSWYQFTPSIKSDKEVVSASATLQTRSNHTGALDAVGKKMVDGATRPQRAATRGSMIASIGSGFMGALRGLKDSVIRSGSTQSAHQGVSGVFLGPDAGNEGGGHEGESSRDSDDVDEEVRGSDLSFRTAHEGIEPIFQERSTVQLQHEYEGSSGIERSLDSFSVCDATKTVEKNRLVKFLVSAKTRILVRLMSAVTLRSINHENICCINTAILILMFEHRRGNLGETLNEIREISTKCGKCYCHVNSNEKKITSDAPGCTQCDVNIVPGASPAVEPATSGDPDPMSRTISSFLSQSRDGCMYCKPYRRYEGRPTLEDVANEEGEKSDCRRGERENISQIFLNFRQLLWFWHEYYLRRGRDRLSLEFSSQIPFANWKTVVDVLCGDNSSPTSLVSCPISCPESVYSEVAPIADVILVGNSFEQQMSFPATVTKLL